MNAETRAKEILGEVDEKAIAVVAETMGADHAKAVVDFLGRIERELVNALRQAENDKLEEAACAATAAGQLWAKEDRDPTRAGCGTEIAKLIRSLKKD